MARFDSEKRGRTALCGVLGAGALAVLWLACAVPSGRVGLTAAAGLFPMFAALTAGPAAGYLCWAAAGLLGLILLPDKGLAVLFVTFLGLYPVVKGGIEGLRRLPLEWVLKLALFNLALSLFWFVLRELLLFSPPPWLERNLPLLYGAGNGVFVVYDLGLTRLAGTLGKRLGRGARRR